MCTGSVSALLGFEASLSAPEFGSHPRARGPDSGHTLESSVCPVEL